MIGVKKILSLFTLIIIIFVLCACSKITFNKEDLLSNSCVSDDNNKGVSMDLNSNERSEFATSSTTRYIQSTIKSSSNVQATTKPRFNRKTNFVMGGDEYGFCEECDPQDMAKGARFSIEYGYDIAFVISGITKTFNSNDFKVSVHENGFAEITKCLSNKNVIEVPTNINGYKIAYIGNECFVGTNAKKIIIPEGVLAIGERSFAELTSLKSVLLPQSLIVVGTEAFYNCISLGTLKFGKNLQVIGEESFALCKSLSSIEIPTNVRVIASGAFSTCESLLSVKLNKGLLRLGGGAFSNTSIREIVVPEGIHVMNPGVFGDCKNLKKAILPEKLGDAYNGFGAGMFGGCTSLEEVRIPNNVKGILQGTFQDCVSLKSITIPKSVEFMSFGVFAGCKNLKDIYFESKDCDILANNFMFMPGLRIHAPKGGSVEKYIRFNPLIKFVATD